ncbi:hypothetical protein K0T92_07160 [Paenibacillus oenotherae]|uniref:Uncharacterized protein n=1 Tax=Paenibacillus oenotherae TaxID=1435645 RepID=A0ABS7D3L3_9BACL|nr:hypothetical protein [Paenibacillus oenotherae]MBW7474520.1 hypothetical protein [Paenibacillus oenotherae]
MMSLLRKEQESRIELIRSIARSQGAIARILDSIADISEHTPEVKKSIRENMRSLTAMQLTMAETVSGLRMRRVRQGSPARPWLHQGAYAPLCSGASRRPQTTEGESR